MDRFCDSDVHDESSRISLLRKIRKENWVSQLIKWILKQTSSLIIMINKFKSNTIVLGRNSVHFELCQSHFRQSVLTRFNIKIRIDKYCQK